MSVSDKRPTRAFAPYPGLRPFEREEAGIFFGREEEIAGLVSRLEHRRLLAVIGSSGCGKSSLIRAGLFGALDAGDMSRRGARWRMIDVVPGSDPIGSLESAVAFALGKNTEGAAGPDSSLNFRDQGPSALSRALARAAAEKDSPNTSYVILVDQFEEIFPSVNSGPVSSKGLFVDLILDACRSEQAVYVILTMRSDYIGECGHFPELAKAVTKSFYLTPKLDYQSLRRAITLPAQFFGREFDPATAAYLLSQESVPDFLPKLQHLLRRAWDLSSKGEVIDRSVVDDKAGGLPSALDRHASSCLNELDGDERGCAQWVFRALSEVGPSGQERRRSLSFQQLAGYVADDPGRIAKVVSVFAAEGRSFLVCTDRSGKRLRTDQFRGDQSFDVKISHEALIRNWSTLRDWFRSEAKCMDSFADLVKRARRREVGSEALLGRSAIRRMDSTLGRGEFHRARLSRFIPAATEELPATADDFTLAVNFLWWSRFWSILKMGSAAVLALVVSVAVFWFITNREAERITAVAQSMLLADNAHFTIGDSRSDMLIPLINSIDAVGLMFRGKSANVFVNAVFSMFQVESLIPHRALVAERMSVARFQRKERDLSLDTKQSDAEMYYRELPHLRSPKGKWYLTISRNRHPVIWSRNYRKVREFDELPSKAVEIGFAEDESKFAVKTAEGKVYIYEIHSQKRTASDEPNAWLALGLPQSLKDEGEEARFLKRSPDGPWKKDYEQVAEDWTLEAIAYLFPPDSTGQSPDEYPTQQEPFTTSLFNAREEFSKSLDNSKGSRQYSTAVATLSKRLGIAPETLEKAFAKSFMNQAFFYEMSLSPERGKAESFYRKASEGDQSLADEIDVRKLIVQARDYLIGGDFKHAVDHLREVEKRKRELMPDWIESSEPPKVKETVIKRLKIAALIQEAKEHVSKKDYVKALSKFSEAKALDPGLEFDPKVEAFKRAPLILPEAMKFIDEGYKKEQSSREQRISCFQKAIKSDPRLEDWLKPDKEAEKMSSYD